MRVLHLAASKWTLGVLEAIDAGTHRFNALHGAVEGISHRLLTTTLRRLTAEGAVERCEHEGRILHVEYHLTAAGSDLLQTIHGFCGWASRNSTRPGGAEPPPPTEIPRPG